MQPILTPGFHALAFTIGIVGALGVGFFARWIGLDRDRSFYPTVMIVIAYLYVLFAAIGGGAALTVELVIGTGFALLATLGFKLNPWFVVVALIGHGLFDWAHPHVIDNRGVPPWWPEFCSAYDVTAGVFLAVLLVRVKPPGMDSKT
jgi:hypothetical protein